MHCQQFNRLSVPLAQQPLAVLPAPAEYLNTQYGGYSIAAASMALYFALTFWTSYLMGIMFAVF
jgi:hypothetical protein